jgi:uncharacterized protein (TIGR00730 family)
MKGRKVMTEHQKIVTVFGSSRAMPESNTYKQAFELGKLLAEAGFTVCNGGYGGIMEASSQGAKRFGGRTIGITAKVFEKKPANILIDEEIYTENYIERLGKLTQIADAFIVLKGGVGTLSELSLVWCMTVIGEMRKPIILVGDSWQKVIKNMLKHLVIAHQEKQVLSIVNTPETAVKLLKRLIQ